MEEHELPVGIGNATNVCPPGQFDCVHNRITDNQIITALWVSAAAGVAMLLLFGCLRKHMHTYKMRLKMPNVWIKPPPLPEGGIHQLWSWLYPVFMTSDADLVRTAGLDALMLCWTASLGVQIFLPLTIMGMAILLPINLLGDRSKFIRDSTIGAIAFERLTLSNLARGSQLYWVALLFVYVSTGYVCWLLVKYYQSYAILRQRYMTGGEALINQWHNRIMHGSGQGGKQGSQLPMGGKAIITPAQSLDRLRPARLAGTPAESAKFWTAFLELIDMDNLADSFGGGSLDMAIMQEAPLTAALLTRRNNSLPLGSAAHRRKSGEATLGRSSQAKSSEDIRAHLKQCLAERQQQADAAPEPAAPESEQESSLRAAYSMKRQGSAPTGQEEAGEQQRSKSLRGMLHNRLNYLSSQPSASSLDEGKELRQPDEDAAEQAPEPISRYETLPPKDTGAPRIQRWWVSGGEEGLEGQQLVGKPSVFFRKTVNAQAPGGRCVAVNAQQYAVLVTDVPDLRASDGPRAQIWKPWLRGLKRRLFSAVPERRWAKDKSKQMEEGGLASKMVAGASPVAGTTPVQRAGSPAAFDMASADPGTAVQGDVEAGMGISTEAAAGGEESWHSEAASLTRLQLVEATFQRLFPDAFLYALPVWKHQAVDRLLLQWDAAYARLQAAEAAFEAGGRARRPTRRMGACGLTGRRVDAIDFWAQRVRFLEGAVERERARCLGAEPCPAFFAFFRSQKDAAFAAQTRLHPEDGHCFCVTEAPGPDEVNWQVLWKGRRERSLREVAVFPLIVLIMLVPMGLFTGTLAQASNAICGGTGRVTGRLSYLHTSWYCEEGSLARPLITSLVPSLLLTLWQSLIMPIVLYIFAQLEARWPSYTALDRRISSLFFTWGVFNVFLGAMLGGSVFSKIRLVLAFPSRIPEVLGTALTSSSNFFINFVIIQAFAVNPSRLLFPYIGVLYDLAQCCGCCRPRSDRDRVLACSAMSIAYGREVGMIFVIYIMALAYAACSPMILPFTLCYFLSAWVMWRYTCLYVTERCYESGGRLWDQVFDNVCWCLFIFEFFTGCVFLANSAFIQASVLWVTLTPLLYRFHRYAKGRWGEAVAHMPLETSHTAPPAYVDPTIYTPPALRPGAVGWWPEYGKAWENWGVPAVHVWNI